MRPSSPALWARSVGSVLRAGLSDSRLEGNAAAKRGFVTWARSIWLEGARLSFTEFPWLADIYDDRSANIVSRKCTQTGFTIWAILRAMHGLQTLYRAVLYYMPTKGDVSDFVQARVNPIIAENAALEVLGTNNVGVKRIGTGYLYFRGMKSPTGLKSAMADFVIFDEHDDMDPVAIQKARKRLAASPIAHEVDIGNPSLPDYGIAAEYDESDQRAWHLRCPCCHKWACPDLHLPDEMGKEIPCIGETTDGAAHLVCEHCNGGLDARAEGRWIPMMPGQGRRHGYWLSQINRPSIDLAAFLREYRHPKTLAAPFMNMSCGKPYADARDRVTAQQVLALCGDWPIQTSCSIPCTMGVDTGKDFHWVVSHAGPDGTRIYVAMGIATGYADLDRIMKRFHVYRGVIDAMPEIKSTRKWIRDHHRGRVFGCFFNEKQRGMPRWDDAQSQVLINRAEALDASRDVVHDELARYPHRGPTMEEYALHMSHDAKRLEEDKETGAQVYRYVRLQPPNHWSLAATYDAMCWNWGGALPTGSTSTGGVGRTSTRRRPSPIPGARRRRT